MYLINHFNKLCRTTKVVSALSSKVYISRSFLLCSCQAQNKVEFKNDKVNQVVNKAPTDGTLPSESKDDFIKIYRNRAVVAGAIVNRLKWYQTLITVCSVPTSLALVLSGTITEVTSFGIIFTSVWLTVLLYLQGYIFHRTIGLIYLHKDRTIVKIAYLDFWGNKEEEEYLLEDVVPFSDLPQTFTSEVFKTVELETDKYRLYLRFGGQILDKDGFVTVFGDVE